MPQSLTERANAICDLVIAASPDQRDAKIKSECGDVSDLHNLVQQELEIRFDRLVLKFCDEVMDDAPYLQREKAMQRFAGDPQLRDRVLRVVTRMLEFDAKTDIDVRPPHFLPASLVDSSPLIDQQVGEYRIARRIGKGGFGAVYLANRVDPTKRPVAVKILHSVEPSTELRMRFNRECMMLANLRHEGIAHYITHGELDDKTPYLVMEFVDGIKITDYCDQLGLSIRERVELFIEVCNAVQQAHIKSLVHRDIKPSNILVEHERGNPANSHDQPQSTRALRGRTPKLIDFGIALSLDPKFESSQLTADAPPMTPAYASPEQMTEPSCKLDSRTDIYSLGLVLYELLTGGLPYPIAGKTPIQIAAVKQEDPKLPSETVLETVIRHEFDSKSNTTVPVPLTAESRAADRKGRSPEKIRKEISGDLENIVLKSLSTDLNRKSEARRYDTVQSLVQDLKNWLTNEPVTATAPTRMYRFRKFVRRNGIPVAAICVVVISLISGFFVYLATQYGNLQRDRAEAATMREQETQSELEAKNLDAMSHSAFGWFLYYWGTGQEQAAEEFARLMPRETFEYVGVEFLQGRQISDEQLSKITPKGWEAMACYLIGEKQLREGQADIARRWYARGASKEEFRGFRRRCEWRVQHLEKH